MPLRERLQQWQNRPLHTLDDLREAVQTAARLIGEAADELARLEHEHSKECQRAYESGAHDGFQDGITEGRNEDRDPRR